MPEKATIGLDYSHNNVVTLEASSYADFTNFLFTSGYKLGKIQAGFDNLKKLEAYDMILLSTPRNTTLSEKEIEILETYVKEGGSLLITSSGGSDYLNNTNLNQLTSKFGFEFEKDQINDSMSYLQMQKRPLLTKFTPHYVTENIKKIVYSSACSIKVLGFIGDNEDIQIDELITSGLNCWRKRFEKEKDDWIQEDSPKIPLMVAVQYHEGRVIGFGSLSMFSSLGSGYGFSAFDNDVLIANIFRYLTSKSISEGKAVTVTLNLELFYWANALMTDSKEGNWENISDIVNLSLKYFKDNYKEIIDHIKRMQYERLEKKKEYEEAKEETAEDKILEMVPIERKREDLEDIMSALEEITGEKYELSIDIEDKKENTDKEALEEDKEEMVEISDTKTEREKIEERGEKEEKKQEKKEPSSDKDLKIMGSKTEREKIEERMEKEEKKKKKEE